MTYTKEYDEALSRLNAPERSPLPYAPIPYGPVPNKCNYAHWNRVMAETRQGTLPKYSILQRIDLGTQNDLAHPSDDVEYTFTLDPSFTFAKGARKSIAVRKVDIYNVIPHGQTVQAHEVFDGAFTLVINTRNVGQRTASFAIQDVVFTCSNDKIVSMFNFAKAFGDMIIKLLNENTEFNGKFRPYPAVEYDQNANQIDIDIIPNGGTTIVRYSVDSVGGNPAELHWAISASNIYITTITQPARMIL